MFKFLRKSDFEVDYFESEFDYSELEVKRYINPGYKNNYSLTMPLKIPLHNSNNSSNSSSCSPSSSPSFTRLSSRILSHFSSKTSNLAAWLFEPAADLVDFFVAGARLGCLPLEDFLLLLLEGFFFDFAAAAIWNFKKLRQKRLVSIILSKNSITIDKFFVNCNLVLNSWPFCEL